MHHLFSFGKTTYQYWQLLRCYHLNRLKSYMTELIWIMILHPTLGGDEEVLRKILELGNTLAFQLTETENDMMEERGLIEAMEL